MEKNKVCILFITYNHVKYVREALESILMQKTTFLFKIVVGDDCSKDGTREIITDYAASYPDKFILSNSVNNLGAEKNFNQLLAKCIDLEPDYIAYLEGDDYWLDEYRLQKQFDIMENKPDLGLVYGKYKILDNDNRFIKFKLPSYRSGYVFEDIITCKFFPSLHSTFFRASIIKKIFTQENFMGVDFYIVSEIAKGYKLQYMDEYFFVYRQTAGSVTKIRSDDVTKQFNQVLEIYSHEYPALVKKGLDHGGRKLLYNQVDDNPSVVNLLQLFKKFEFSFLHQRQIIKWFYLRMKNLGVR
ncbi:MAG: glycosyltransferase [Ferruginibacter sp.]